MIDLQHMESMSLTDHLIVCAAERGMLIADGADDKTLANAQSKVDMAQQEVLRRMAW